MELTTEDQGDINGTLHIFGQNMWHGPAYIVGNRAALVLLRAAIDNALKQGIHKGLAHTYSFQNDGEGYDIAVHLLPDEEMEKLACAYHAHGYGFEKDDGIHPSAIPLPNKVNV